MKTLYEQNNYSFLRKPLFKVKNKKNGFEVNIFGHQISEPVRLTLYHLNRI